MTTNFPRADNYTTPSSSQINLYGAQQISPINSASATPMNVSPTSPRNPSQLPHLPLHTRQLRPPKSPLYVPAVLRPTERPIKQTPLTPPRSVHGSLDSLDGVEAGRMLSRRSTGESMKKAGSSRLVEGERIGESGVGTVTGLPTREHWKPDANALVCDSPTCQKSFSLFERRHHCRHCGHVFCNYHSPYHVPLDQDAHFHPDGTYARACQHCWDQYRKWEAARCSRSNSVGSTGTDASETPTLGMLGGKAQAGTAPLTSDQSKGSVASSVPRDWSWSTF